MMVRLSLSISHYYYAKLHGTLYWSSLTRLKHTRSPRLNDLVTASTLPSRTYRYYYVAQSCGVKPHLH